MRPENYNLVADLYAWIEFFLGSRAGDVVKQYLSEALIIYTPSIVLAELARKYLREGVDIGVIKERLDFIAEISTIVNIDIGVSLEAAESYLELRKYVEDHKMGSKPSLADAIILAISRLKDAKILTGDIHFKNLSQTIWIGQVD